jgi:hypothetical protein
MRRYSNPPTSPLRIVHCRAFDERLRHVRGAYAACPSLLSQLCRQGASDEVALIDPLPAS